MYMMYRSIKPNFNLLLIFRNIVLFLNKFYVKYIIGEHEDSRCPSTKIALGDQTQIGHKTFEILVTHKFPI